MIDWEAMPGARRRRLRPLQVFLQGDSPVKLWRLNITYPHWYDSNGQPVVIWRKDPPPDRICYNTHAKDRAHVEAPDQIASLFEAVANCHEVYCDPKTGQVRNVFTK